MKTWKYKKVNAHKEEYDEINDIDRIIRFLSEEELNALGNEGWELVDIKKNVYYFKKESVRVKN